MRTLLSCLAFALLLPAQSLEPEAKSYREKPSPKGRASLLRFAEAHPKDSGGAVALFTLGVTDVENGNYNEGIRQLEQARARLPRIQDYIAFYIGSARVGLQDFAAAIRELETVWKQTPPSPLLVKSVLLAAKAYQESGTPGDAVSLLKSHFARLPQPAAGLALASGLEAAGDPVPAADQYQRVYYGYPTQPEASEAGAALKRLKQNLGSSYPPAMPTLMLERANKLLDAGQHAKARAEFESLLPQLGGEHRDIARAGLGVADYHRGRTQEAYTYLDALQVESEEADARRLYCLVQCARKLGDKTKMLEFVDNLNRRHPQSEWRLQALVWAANGYLLENDAAAYEPLFHACHEDFPGGPQAEYCHWRTAWSAYLRRDPRAGARLRGYLERFPQGNKTAAALYYLGRLSEKTDATQARSYYEEVLGRFPLHFYRPLAEQRLKDLQPVPARTPGQSQALAAEPAVSFQPSAETRYWIERARLLDSAGMPMFAESELRFGSGNGGQPHVLAMELAKSAGRRGEYGQSLRYIKSVFPTYLSLPLDGAPAEFWQLAFPLPFRGEMERYCRVYKLDLWLIAGLIRQESEFDPKALSRAGARGLMQVLPSTGRQLSRRLAAKSYRASMLSLPDFNIRLGTYYFRSVLDELDGRIEPALAAYNGGKTRVGEWTRWASFEEPAEFIESIPLTETRGYVQAVLRNAHVYRLLYGSDLKPHLTRNGAAAPAADSPTMRPSKASRRRRPW